MARPTPTRRRPRASSPQRGAIILPRTKLRIEIPDKCGFLLGQRAPYKCLYGGRGSAKSWTMAICLLLLGMQRKMLILCAREFQTSIAQSVHRLLKAQVYRLGLSAVYDVRQTTIVNRYNGTEFIFAGLRHNIDSIRSMEGIDICWIEEGESITEESWEVLDPTIRSAHGEIWVSFNPREETDPTWKRMVKNPMPGTIAVKLNWQDNKWLSPRLRSQLLHMRKTDPERYHHVWEGGLWSKSIIHVLNGKWGVDNFHVLPTWQGPLLGSDFGFSQDPTTLVKTYIDQVVPDHLEGGDIVVGVQDLYVAEEAFGIGIDTNDIPATLYDTVSESRLYNITADSARPETISALSKAGYLMTACQKWPGCVEDGISWLRSFRKIVIHSDCVNMQEEARLWSYKVDKAGKPTRLLKPGFDHGWDAVRYGNESIITHEPSMFDVQGQLM